MEIHGDGYTYGLRASIEPSPRPNSNQLVEHSELRFDRFFNHPGPPGDWWKLSPPQFKEMCFEFA